MEIKTGIFTDIFFHNEENGYTIAELETEDEILTVVGSISNPSKGMRFELKGQFRIHPRYGEQFAFIQAVEQLPTTTKGIEEFLASGAIKGVGSKMAVAITGMFGEETLDIIEKSPKKLCKVSGIGEKKAEMIAESFALHREFADVSIKFQKFGISSTQALKLYKAYGKDAPDIIAENPYRLADELYGFGFHRADQVAFKMGGCAGFAV